MAQDFDEAVIPEFVRSKGFGMTFSRRTRATIATDTNVFGWVPLRQYLPLSPNGDWNLLDGIVNQLGAISTIETVQVKHTLYADFFSRVSEYRANHTLLDRTYAFSSVQEPRVPTDWRCKVQGDRSLASSQLLNVLDDADSTLRTSIAREMLDQMESFGMDMSSLFTL